MRNPIVRQGEHGGFKWCFRRFWMDISTLSGNFSARFMADEHPYSYLLTGMDDENIEGFCQVMYMLGKMITTDQGLVNDVQKAFKKYQARLDKQAKVEDDETIEDASIADVKADIEHTNMKAKDVRKINRKFRKVAKKIEKKELQDEQA